MGDQISAPVEAPVAARSAAVRAAQWMPARAGDTAHSLGANSSALKCARAALGALAQVQEEAVSFWSLAKNFRALAASMSEIFAVASGRPGSSVFSTLRTMPR